MTIQEAKEKIKQYDLFYSNPTGELIEAVMEVCKEQRKEVANELLNHEIDWDTPIKIDTQAFKKLILNSPEPKF